MEMRKRKVLLVKVGRYLSSKQLYESNGHVGDGKVAGVKAASSHLAYRLLI